MNGVLVIDKPKGLTSHDVVARVRRVLRAKKAGHGGTLDPLATGVLPVYLNEGTKLVPFNLEGSKEYIATLKLGEETDTLDAEGRVVAQNPGFVCGREEMEKILEKFRGKIRQTPPLFSAIKLEGVPLYRRARAGERPQVAEREVTVHALKLRAFRFPLATLEITCSRGTYVRTLCADIGRALGCGAHLTELRRCRSGRFTLDQALSLEELARLVQEGRIGERVISLRGGVEVSGEIWVAGPVARQVRQGRPLRAGDLPVAERAKLKKGQRVGLLHGPGELLAIAETQAEEGAVPAEGAQVMRILRVFHG